jgi:hypothetical protein
LRGEARKKDGRGNVLRTRVGPKEHRPSPGSKWVEGGKEEGGRGVATMREKKKEEFREMSRTREAKKEGKRTEGEVGEVTEGVGLG